MVNSIVIVGRVAEAPRITYQDDGTPSAKLVLAVDRPVKRVAGQDHPADTFTVHAEGKLAQLAADYVRKGTLLGVQGRMDMSSAFPAVIAGNLRLLGSKAQVTA